jgi:hypothetical protein
MTGGGLPFDLQEGVQLIGGRLPKGGALGIDLIGKEPELGQLVVARGPLDRHPLGATPSVPQLAPVPAGSFVPILSASRVDSQTPASQARQRMDNRGQAARPFSPSGSGLHWPSPRR